MINKRKLYPANANVIFEFDEGHSVRYDIFDITGDYYRCVCDVNTMFDYRDISDLQQWWRDADGQEIGAQKLTEEEKKEIKEYIQDTIFTMMPNLSSECENCNE